MTVAGSPDAGPAADAPDGPAAPTAVVEQRIRAVAPHLLVDAAAADLAGLPFVDLLQRVLDAVCDDPDPERLWLLLTGLAGCFPDEDVLMQAVRTLHRHERTDATMWLLDTALALSSSAGTVDWPLRVVADGVVVDVSHSAQHDLHTGIQRVVRSTLPTWVAEHPDLVPVVFAPDGASMRGLHDSELDRVLRWAETGGVGAVAGRRLPGSDDSDADVLIVPWRSTVVLLEVPSRAACARLATIGQRTPNRVTAVGYDCIPVVSSLMVPLAEPNRFVHYLTVVKWTDAVAGISVAATDEFRGFGRMLQAQGVTGPVVTECTLPAAVGSPARPADTDEPLVLCVGSFEPRKNQAAVLYAAEVLWREGLRFRLEFIGGSGWWSAFTRDVARARRHRRPVTHRTAVSDAELESAYAAARFTVFVSQHEGYGLPVAESLERGVPVLTSDLGSMRELGAAGGAVLVDPRDDDAIVVAMRDLLTDDALLARLRTDIAGRTTRTWDDYGRELWDQLVAPVPADDAARLGDVTRV